MRGTSTKILYLLVVIVLALAAVSCDGKVGGGGNLGGGQPQQKVSLNGLNITVGSKDFTEQLVLGQIAVQALEARGATVTDRTGLASTSAARKALTSGKIDAYWEYTGTGWLDHLGYKKPILNSKKQFEAVAREDLKKNDIKWLAPPAPANDAYAIAVRSEAAPVLGVKSISSLAVLSELRPEEVTLCAENEFLTRKLDGLPGLEKAYGFEIPKKNITRMQEEPIYQATDKGEECNFGEVFVTDGRSRAFGLTLLKDDKNFFPIYNPSLNVRKEVYDNHPDIKDVFAPISKKLDNQTLQKLNASVAVDGKSPESVAHQFLKSNGLL